MSDTKMLTQQEIETGVVNTEEIGERCPDNAGIYYHSPTGVLRAVIDGVIVWQRKCGPNIPMPW